MIDDVLLDDVISRRYHDHRQLFRRRELESAVEFAYEGSQALAFQKAERQAFLSEKLNEKVVQTNSLRMVTFIRRLLQIGRHQRQLLAL